MNNRKGYFVKHTFNQEFVDLMEDLYKKYGETIFSIQGIANKHMDVASFSKDFFGKSSNLAVAELSVDGNANVRDQSICAYTFENNKALMKLNSLYMMYKWVKKTFDKESAKAALEKVINGEIFVNDLTNFNTSYCFAFDLRMLIENGMDFFHGNMKIKPPKRSESFIAQVIQSTAFISNQIMGASSYPNFFPILDWFYRKEFGENYAEHMENEDVYNKIKNQFQNLIFSLNYPFRGNQSAFTNLSVMDKGFCEALLKDHYFPDGTLPDIDSTVKLSQIFFDYFTEINGEEGIFTFPVTTIAISLDENNNYIDPTFVDWAAKANSKKALANIFQSPPNSFSSCCRLLNKFDKMSEMGYQNSFGVGGLSIGSHRIVGLNLPRLALLENDNPNILQENLDLMHKILYSHRQLLKDKIKRGYLPLYTHNWINLNRQYSTIGFIGSYEYLLNKGLSIKTDAGVNCLTDMLKTIEKNVVIWQEAEKKEKNIYNIEQIPGESMAIRLKELDGVLKFNPNNFKLYSNQYIPLIENASISDRFDIQGKIDSLTSGGAILHINIDDEKPLSEEQFKKIILMGKETKTVYFAINYAFSECEKEHYNIGKLQNCKICGGKIVRQYTRVVGFITPVSSWNKVRRDEEYPNRHFYKFNEIFGD